MPDSQHPVEHVLNERERVRVQSEPNPPVTLSRKAVRTPSGNEPEPTITIDGKIASEAQLAQLDERDIASIAVYKGKEALMQMVSDGKLHLEMKSGPATRIGAKDSEALIAVKTKIRRQLEAKRP